ncbi:retroviral-like aspartic protease family protein [Altererythrobacter lauratis]|uniref:Retroviral-like aspartic protease family protein n=1 Tax=Alteraurantiacibacter lauratis TaxID=2054627 RepID=A0ABV7EJ36_9SPHN
MHWLSLIASTALATASAADAQVAAPIAAAALADETVEVLQLQDELYSRMTVPVMINGQGPFNFMIDTGAQASVLSHALADRLQLTERESATLVGMASERRVETALIDEISFGSGIYRDGVAALVEGDNIGGADGILGLDSLQDRRVLIDFENRQMEVAHPGERQSNRGFDIVVRAQRVAGQLIIARAVIDGVRTAVIVDTGAQGSIGNAALERRLRSRRDNAAIRMTDINGVEALGAIRYARSLVMDEASINNFPVTFAESPTFAAMGLEDEPAMILGMSELRLFRRVAIDFASRRVLFDLPANTRLQETRGWGQL